MEPEEQISAYARLNDRQKALVDAYFANGMVKWKAYRDAFEVEEPTDPAAWTRIYKNASNAFRNGDVSEAVNDRLRLMAMPAEEALARLAEQARNEAAEFIDEKGRLDLRALFAAGKAHLIKGTKFDKDGELVVELYDAQSALKLIGQAHRLFGALGTADDPIHHVYEVEIPAPPPVADGSGEDDSD